MIENTVDPATGMATVRATMPNKDELLWPGTLVNAELTLRSEEAVVVPSTAVQVSQTGNFVFVVKDGVAKVQPVKVERARSGSEIGDRLRPQRRRDGRHRRPAAAVERHRASHARAQAPSAGEPDA